MGAVRSWLTFAAIALLDAGVALVLLLSCCHPDSSTHIDFPGVSLTSSANKTCDDYWDVRIAKSRFACRSFFP